MEGMMVRKSRKGECFRGITFKGGDWNRGIMAFGTVCIVRWGLLVPQNTHPPAPHMSIGLHPTIFWASDSPLSLCSMPTQCA